MTISSFDIFDTCLLRDCGQPEMVFDLLAREILGHNALKEQLRDFARLRQDAQRMAMERKNDAEVTIDEIYEQFDASYYTSISNEQIKEKEIEIDAKSWQPIEGAIRIINECREKGKVIFISDMYYPASILKPVLERFDIIQPEDQLYVSCDYGVSKHSGELYDIVAEHEHIHFSEWTHYGDNPYSDYMVPRKKGIKSHRIHTENTDIERTIYDLAAWSSDSMPKSLLAGILRAVRLTLPQLNDGGFMSDVMCGMIVPYVFACLKDAQKRGLRRLYFASRDAYIMYLVAKEFKAIFPDIECKYLYISTKVAYPLLVKDGTADEIFSFLRNINVYQPKHVLTMLGLSEEQQSEISAIVPLRESIKWDSAESRKLVDELIGASYRDTIVRHCHAQSELFKAYLTQEEFLTNTPNVVGLVDVGWRCSTQYSLSSIFPHAMYYYLGVSPDNYRMDEMGNYWANYFLSYYRYVNPRFIEYYICKNLENTVVGFRDVDGIIVPRFAEGKISDSLRNDFELRVNFLTQCAHYVSKYADVIMGSIDEWLNCSKCILETVSIYPTKEISAYLADKLYCEHYSEELPVIFKVTPFRYLLGKLLPKNSRYNKRYQLYWRSASLSYTYGLLGLKIADAFYAWRKNIKK